VAGKSFQGATTSKEKAARLKAKFAGGGCSRGWRALSPLGDDSRAGVKVNSTA